jgi:hypothetical protein
MQSAKQVAAYPASETWRYNSVAIAMLEYNNIRHLLLSGNVVFPVKTFHPAMQGNTAA